MLTEAKAALRAYGPWAGVRFLRNRGCPFTVAYMARFGRLPRL